MKEAKFKRKCAGCNSLKSKDELIKITHIKASNEIIVSPTNNQFGRSVYICKDKNCLNEAVKKGKLFKILKVKPDDLLKEKIRAVLENRIVLNI